MTTKEAILNKEATFIDIRNADELESDGQLEGARHIPLHDIPNHIDDIKDMPKPIVIFCRSGGRATRAIEFLNDHGIDELYNGGGLNDVLNIQKEG